MLLHFIRDIAYLQQFPGIALTQHKENKAHTPCELIGLALQPIKNINGLSSLLI